MKNYLIVLHIIPIYNEVRIKAKNKKEACKKVKKLPLIKSFEIGNIEEVK